MRRENFNLTIIVLSRSIRNAASADELYVISQQIEQAAEDFKFFHIPNLDTELADLREQLEDRIQELKRDADQATDLKCCTHSPS